VLAGIQAFWKKLPAFPFTVTGFPPEVVIRKGVKPVVPAVGDTPVRL
jgi:hypothetical protein